MDFSVANSSSLEKNLTFLEKNLDEIKLISPQTSKTLPETDIYVCYDDSGVFSKESDNTNEGAVAVPDNQIIDLSTSSKTIFTTSTPLTSSGGCHLYTCQILHLRHDIFDICETIWKCNEWYDGFDNLN